jgi:serine/threonine protein kinase
MILGRLVFNEFLANIGFDLRGDVKVFDFGLCKDLTPALKAQDGKYGYRLTGRAGSLPYMAPEVVKLECYDTKADVFSFAILLWEMMALQKAFADLSPAEFVEKVAVGNERLKVPPRIPPLTRLMIPEAWDADPAKRPDMKRIAILLRGDLNDMTTDPQILSRTNHMRNKSEHSLEFDLMAIE